MDQDTEDIQPPEIMALSDVQKDFSAWSSLKQIEHHVSLDLKDGLERKAVISQIRSLDSKRLVDKMAVVDVNTFMKIQQTVIDMFR
jgi:mRNA-degrading endonuclease toxin of MazEF toxin-antitoxin module